MLPAALLQIGVLKDFLEDNGIDPAEVLRSAEIAHSEEDSIEDDEEDQDEDEEDEDEEDEEDSMDAVASATEQEGAQSPGEARGRALSPHEWGTV